MSSRVGSARRIGQLEEFVGAWDAFVLAGQALAVAQRKPMRSFLGQKIADGALEEAQASFAATRDRLVVIRHSLGPVRGSREPTGGTTVPAQDRGRA